MFDAFKGDGEFKFAFSDNMGNFYGDRNNAVPDELKKAHDRVLNEAKMAAECMSMLEQKYGVRDPGDLMAWLANFIFSFYINDHVDVREPSEISMKVTDMKKKSDAIIASMMQHTKGGPDEVIAILALAFNMLHTATKVAREKVKPQQQQSQSAYDLFAEVEKSIRKNLGK